MALLSLKQELARAREGAPFASGCEGVSWMSLWCYDCVTDEDTCPLILVALNGKTPAAWIDREPGGLNRYTCREHEEIVYVTVEDES